MIVLALDIWVWTYLMARAEPRGTGLAASNGRFVIDLFVRLHLISRVNLRGTGLAPSDGRVVIRYMGLE